MTRLALFALLVQSASAQDAVFEARIDSAAAAMEQVEEAGALQRAFAAEAFDYFSAHPGTATGRRAGETAFLLWQHADARAEATAALLRTDPASPLWPEAFGRTLSTFNSLYGTDPARARAASDSLYRTLYRTVGPGYPDARAEMLRLMINVYQMPPDSVATLAREIVALAASPESVAEGEGYLREVETLHFGMVPPDLTAVTVDGDTLSLASLRGRPVLIDFWATWCGPCVRELDTVKRALAAHPDLAVVGVSFDPDRETLAQTVAEHGVTWPQVFVGDGFDGQIPRDYNVHALPRTFLLDRDGRIAAKDWKGERLIAQIARVAE